jgi:cytochrome P450
MERTVDLPALDVESDEFRSDPPETFDRLRERTWVARSGRGFEVFSHAGVEAAYQNTDLVAGVTKILADMGLDPEAMAGGGGNMQGTEGPDHTRFRRVVSRWFTPRRVDELRPRVQALVDSLVEPFTDAGGGEFMTAVANKVPGPVFCWMLGAPEDEGDRLFRLSEVLIGAFEGDLSRAQEIFDAAMEMQGFVEELIAAKRDAPGDDLLSIMLAAADEGDITLADVSSLSFEMLAASTDNTAHSAGLALWLLAAHPEQWAHLRSDASLLSTAVEECMRVAPRVCVDTAYTAGGTTLLDLDVPPDTMVYQHTAAANVDPAVYPDPRRVDISRTHARPQMNFGIGRHFCLGAALARMELQVILGAAAARWAELALDGDPDIVRLNSATVKSLPIACAPA